MAVKVLSLAKKRKLRVVVDNDLEGLEDALRDLGYTKARQAPKFEHLAKRPSYRGELWKDLAIHHWLQENAEVFLTSNYADFLKFAHRKYWLIGIPQKLRALRTEKLAKIVDEFLRWAHRRGSEPQSVVLDRHFKNWARY